jgi:hypothetical protein
VQSTGLPWSGLVSARSLPCLLPVDALPDGAFPPVGRLGLTSPLSSVLCAATTAHSPSQVASLVARRPDTLPVPVVRGVRYRLVARCKPLCHARAFGHPVPHSGSLTRRQVAVPRSRVLPVKTCPALRPRWYPGHSPSRTQDCCLPALAHRRLSSLYHFERSPSVHNPTHFGAPSRGLPSRDPRLRTAPYGEAHGFASDLWARRSSGGTGTVVRTHWETYTNFMGLHPIPRFRAYLGASKALLGSDLSPRPALARRAPCPRPYGETVPDAFSPPSGRVVHDFTRLKVVETGLALSLQRSNVFDWHNHGSRRVSPRLGLCLLLFGEMLSAVS